MKHIIYLITLLSLLFSCDNKNNHLIKDNLKHHNLIKKIVKTKKNKDSLYIIKTQNIKSQLDGVTTTSTHQAKPRQKSSKVGTSG